MPLVNKPSLRSEFGGSAIIMALGVTLAMFFVFVAVRNNLDRGVELNSKMNSVTELRLASSSALEVVSQLLNSGALSVPLPGNKVYGGGATTAQREAQDAQALLTRWNMHGASSEDLGVESDDDKTMTFLSCRGRMLKASEIKEIYEGGDNFECDRFIRTQVTLKSVKVSQYMPGRFELNYAEVKRLVGLGMSASRYGEGWALRGVVRRNFFIEAESTLDGEGLLGFGKGGSGKGDKSGGKGGSGGSGGKKKKGSSKPKNSKGEELAHYSKNVVGAVLTQLTDVPVHKCPWEQTDSAGNKIPWRQKIMFTTDDGLYTLYAMVSKTDNHPGSAAEGLLAYTTYGPMWGWVGGMHKKIKPILGWGVDMGPATNPHLWGTMLYVNNPDRPDCYVSAIPMRGAGNFVGGCFAPGTKISMADGALKDVEAITRGDMVLNPVTQKPQRVATTRKGYESKALLEVGYDGRRVAVTENHPFLMRVGELKQARHLAVGDEVLGEDSEYHAVTELKRQPEEPYQWVYNLSLESDSGAPEQHAVLANGIVTGDHFLQNQLEARLFAETGRSINAAETRLSALTAGSLE